MPSLSLTLGLSPTDHIARLTVRGVRLSLIHRPRSNGVDAALTIADVAATDLRTPWEALAPFLTTPVQNPL